MFRNVSDKKFAFCTSFFITLLIFSVFFLQIIKFAGSSTFNDDGDCLALTTAAIYKLSSVILNGQIWGLDLDSFNGSTEFMLRANIPTHYPPMILLSIMYGFLSVFKVKQVLLVLFYALHLFVALYCSQRLTQKYFEVNRYLSLLYAVSLLGAYFSAIWYVSFFIVSTIIIPALYLLLEIYNSSSDLSKVKFIAFSAFVYVLVFTSGYIVLSCAATTVLFVYLFIYVRKRQAILEKSIVFSKVVLPYAVSIIIVLLYYISVKEFVGDSFSTGKTLINAVIDLDLPISGLLYMVSRYVNVPIKCIEELYVLSIGILWGGGIFLFIKRGISNRIQDEYKSFFWTGFIVNAICLILCFGAATPLAAWFYYLVPIFGSMHLPIRFFVFLAPFFYLSAVIGLKYVSDEDLSKDILKLVFTIVLISAMLLLLLPDGILTLVVTYRDKILVELIGTLLAIIMIVKKGVTNSKTITIISAMLLCVHVNYLYLIERAYDDPRSNNNNTIVHNIDKRNLLTSYLDCNFDHRKRLRFSVYEKNNGPKQFIPDNYSWYCEIPYRLTGYSGYEAHLCSPREYMELMPYFQVFNDNYINYLNDTRCDILIVKDADISTNDEKRLLSEYTDKPLKLSSEYTLYSFRKHANSIFYGLYENNNSILDNGYFYSPDLNNDSIVSFDTNDSSRFVLEYQSEYEAHITFLFYANRFLHYYVDNQEIKPEIIRGQAYWNIPGGRHVLSVKYESKKVIVGEIIIFGFYLSILVMGLAHCTRIMISKIYRRRDV